MDSNEMFEFMKWQDSKVEEKLIIFERFIHFFKLKADVDFHGKNQYIDL